MSVQTQIDRITDEVYGQSTLIQQIKTALEGKSGGGGSAVLPTLTNPGSAEDLALDKQLIGADGKVVIGTLVEERVLQISNNVDVQEDDGTIEMVAPVETDAIVRQGISFTRLIASASKFGDARPEDVAQGKIFTSVSGLCVTGTAEPSGGMVVKAGTTTSRTIDTDLSDVEQFFLYKESVTGTGLIHLHYTKTATSRMYASAWSTQNYGTKTITNGTGGVTVSGGTVTISATQATQGALTSNVSYKWIAVGTE